MKTKTTLQEVGNFIECCKYISPFHKNIQQEGFSKISLKSFLILILGLAMYSSAVVAQEIPVRIGNTLPSNKATSKMAKTMATTEAVSALAAVAGSIDVANPTAGYNGYNADQLVRNVLTSGCLTISNVRFGYYKRNNNNWTWVDHTWSATAGDRQLGYYSKGTSTFPIDEGLLLSTGKISSAMGPNTFTNKSDAMVDEASDPDLASISGRTMHDASILEFNFIPDGNLVEFKFVFASEEYLEYVNTQFNDAFGFFLSGTGITGTYTNSATNLAQLPNGDAVTINNIHSAGTNVNNVTFAAQNDAYYVNNPPASTTMEYDGSTVVLTATYAVTPGQNYKIKMAIADASDQKWDAGVFLKAKSFATNTLVITNPAPVCANGTANITLPAITAGSTAGLTYTYWQDAAATIPYTTPTVAPVGTYYIKGQNTQSGCSDTKPVVVSQTTIVVAETIASHVDVKCKGTATGTATVTATGGTAPYTFSWNTTPAQTSATAINLAAGTYTVTVTDSKGCTGTKQIIITEPATVLTATTSQTNVLCNAGTTGSATVTPAGGTGAYTYSWAPSGGSAATASNLAAGTYTVTIKDANLCTITKTFTITEPTVLTATTSQTNVLCNAGTTGSATVTPAGGTGAYAYSWAPSGGSAATATGLAAGTYTVTIKDANLCTITKTFTITEPTVLTATTSQTNVLCNAGTTGSATVTPAGGTGAYAYSWAPSGGSAATATGLAAGTYTVTIKDANLCTITKTFTITEPTVLTATTSQTNVLCNAGTTGSATVTPAGGTGAYTYSWAPSGGSAATATGLAAGTYTVTIKDANLCTITKTFTITEPTVLTATTSQTNVLCNAGATGSATVTPAGGTGAYTYSWAPSGGSAATATGLAAGTYTVTIKDANLCTITKTFTITEPTVLTATTSQTNVLCNAGTTGSATVTPAGGTGAYTYSWAPSGGSAATASNLAAGTYTVTIKDANLCTITKTFTITEPTVLTATTSQTNVLCNAGTTGSATVTPAGGTGAYTYSWAPSGGSAATASGLAAGTYTVTIKDANLCTITKTFTITEPTVLTATTSQTNVLCNAGTTGSATVTPAGGTGTYTYSWAPSGGSAATASGLAAGTYTVTIKDANLCTITKTFTITEPTVLTATTSQTNVLCNAGTTGSAAVTPAGGTGAYTYSWAPSGGSAATASGLAAGTYTVTIKDANLCTITKTFTITEPTVLTATTSQTNVLCNAGTTGSATVTPAGGTGAYTYSWAPSGGSAATASGLAAGTYTVTIKDANLCTITKTFTITEPTVLTATTSQTNVGCGGDNTGSATITVSGGTLGYTYLWSPSGGTTATANALIAGTYTVTATDANSCTITKSVTIIDGDSVKPIIDPLPQTTTINCPAEPVFATATATDNNGVISSLTYKDQITPGGCAGSYTQIRTWTAVDACGNISLPVSQTIVVQDISAPTWSTAIASLNKTIECSDAQTLTDAQALFPTATDACDTDVSNIVKVSGAFVASQGCSNAGTYTNTWTVKDDCGNTSDTFTQVITIEDTSKPTWSTAIASLNKTIECSDAQALTDAQALFPTATDACDTDVSNIVKVSGAFVASQGCSNAGTYTNTWTVKDDCGNTSDTFTQVITIEDTSKPTWSTAIASLNKTIECSDAQALTDAQALFPTATDACDTDVSNIVKVSGAFVASQGCANAGTYTNTWTVKDDCGNTSDTFTQVITIEDTSKPIWSTAIASLNKTIECSDAQALTDAQALFPTATDACDTDVSNIVKVSGAFVASQGCANAGTYTNTWTVKDDCGNTSDTFTQVITIEDTSKPTWSTAIASLNKTIECSDVQALTDAQALFPTATDACDTDVSNIVKVSGAFVASQGCSNAGTYTNTWTVKDDCGNTSDTFTQVITIEDTSKPTWSTTIASLNKTIECSDAQALTDAQALFPTATDACDTDVSNIVKVSGAFVASQGCSNAGTYTNTWTVKDDCGNTSDTFTQVITLEDTTKPIFTGTLPTDITVSCDAVPEPANVEVSDNCNGNLPIVFTETKSNIENECDTNYTLTRKWTTSDCGGNTASYTQIITVRDTTPPTGTAPIDVANLQTIADIPVGNPNDIKDAVDNCSSTVNITVSDTNNGGSGCDGNAYILTRTYTLSDCAGNKTVLTQTFTVENKVSVTGIATNVSCLGGKDGSILVTNSPGSTVVIRNENNEIVGNTNLPAGTYTLTATSSVDNENQTCTATTTVVITQPAYTIKISGKIVNKDTAAPLANVPVLLIPQGTTTGSIQMQVTAADGLYNFSGMPAGNYAVQVQDANLAGAYQLFPVDSNLFTATLQDCIFQEHNFEYGKSNLPILGDYVWYDTNSNGVQDEWYDANNDGIVTKNTPDGDGAINYSQWEWIDLNGDGSYRGTANAGELNAGGFGNALTPNVTIDGPNGYHKDVTVGIQGYWRDRPETANPYGSYTIKLVKDTNLDTVAAALGATGLVKVLPSVTDKKASTITGKSQLHTVCDITGGAGGYIVTVTAEDLIHLNADFGINCKVLSDIVANDDTAGPITRINQTTPNVLNVLPNDTLEGVTITASDVIITTVTPNPFLQLNANGTVDVLANAPVGTLTLVYQICEADQTSNCDTATVTVTIKAAEPLNAVDDVYSNIGCNTFGLAGNVLSNDVKGITRASLDLVNFTLLADNSPAPKTNPSITFDTSGNVTVSSLTPAGTYTYSYQICDKLSPENCDTATVTITVVPNGVTNISSKACNDDSTPINLLSLLPENTSSTGVWVDSSNTGSIQGNTFNPLGLALGNYTFEYKITDAACPRSIVLNMEVNDDCKVLACGAILVHNAFSPNGDGINDVFTIDSINDTTCYPENEVEIYNRWGVLVFETHNYNNETNAFDGISRGRTTIKQSDGLPTGTYFYIINYKSLDGNNVLQNNKKDGYLYLSK